MTQEKWDFYKTTLRAEHHGITRMKGDLGSEQNNMRGELYSYALQRIKDFTTPSLRLTPIVKRGLAYEIVCLCDSIMTDRICAITQTMRHDNREQFLVASTPQAMKALNYTLDDKGVGLPTEMEDIFERISLWQKSRNLAVHGFVDVTSSNLFRGLEDRLDRNIKIAHNGVELVKELLMQSRKFIAQIKRHRLP